MKKLLFLSMLLLVAACGGLNGDIAGGLSEEPISSASSDEYSMPKMSDDVAVSEEEGTLDKNSLLYAGPKYHIGTPYKIEDIQYTPAEDWEYNQTGIAGIVPVDLNGVATTNGEKFDTNAMIATSKVLPLPSIVKVTNLDSGTSVVVRVNNRGPFVNSRIIDVSPAAAKELGMTGPTKVQVQILEEESKKVKDLTVGTGAVAAVTDEESAEASGVPAVATGPYTVQVGAYYSEDSANSVASKIAGIGAAKVVPEGGMYKVRMTNMTADDARAAIQRLRDEEDMAPGLLKDDRWINVDSI